MESTEKRYNKLKEDLNKADTQKKLAIINSLRNETVFPGVILLLKDILEKDNTALIQTEISKFLNDIKDQSLTQEVLEAIDSSTKDLIQQILIASCWQSGLDYSAYLGRFVEYSINLSYLATLECYSVIEEWVNNCSPEDRSDWKNILTQNLDNQNTEKKKLLEAIISLF